MPGAAEQMTGDRISNVLKWVLLTIAVVTFSLLRWATKVTYESAPPRPEHFAAPDGTVLMTAGDIVAGKGAFQRADLMDYGSIYGMGSYFGEDYTAKCLVRLLNFFPIGWPQLDAVYGHGLAYARSLQFYDTTLLWQWLRFVGDVPFAIAALLMAYDFIVKLGPMFAALAGRLRPRPRPTPAE